MFICITSKVHEILSQVTENVINYQLERHAKTKGINPDEIAPEERATLMDDMIEKHYPGIIVKNNTKSLPKKQMK